jgi:porin
MHRLLALALALVAGLAAAGFAAPAAAQSVLQPGASWTIDALGAVTGSPDSGTDIVGRADAWVDLEGAAIGLDTLSAHIDVMAVHGPDFSGRRLGVYQTISSLEADTLPHIYEAWAQWKLNPHVSAKAGLIDLNVEFDLQNTGALFVNSAFGIGPDISQSGLNGPSIFPMTASAVVLRFEHGRKGLALGVFDALAGSRDDPRKIALRWPGQTGALLIAEARVPIGTWLLQAGAWHYTTRFEALDPARPPAISRGVYGLVEGAVTKQISAWLRLGTADARANPVAAYVGGGAVATLGEWRLGLAAAHARLGKAARRTLFAPDHARRAETVIELTAQRPVASWLLVQPDLQYVVHPGWNPTARSALVAGLRLSFALPDS